MEEGFSEGGEEIIGEEDPEGDHEEDPEEDPAEDGAELTPKVYFEEEPEDLRDESGVPRIKGGEDKDKVIAWKPGRCGCMCRGECPLDTPGSGV